MIDSYNALPLGLYLKIDEILQDEGMEDLLKQARIIALLDGTTEEAVLALPLADYRERAARAAFLSHECPQGRIAGTYALAGVKYHATKDFTKITAAQYVDFQTFCRNGVAGWPELLSVFLIPAGHAYNDGYDLAALQATIREEMSVADALTLTAFFFVAFRQSITDSLIFLRKAAKRRKMTMNKAAKEVEDMLRELGLG